MKLLIYAGIGLFSVASVYGVADFYQTQKKGTLNDLYKEDEEEKVSVKTVNHFPEKNTTAVTDPETEQKVQTTKKKKINKQKFERTIRLEEFSRGRIPVRRISEEVEEPIIIDEPVPSPAPEPVEDTRPVEIEKKPLTIDTRKKISLKNFSRAPLINKEKIKKEEAILYEM